MKNTLESLNWRYATKKFDPAAIISDEQWKAIEETLRLCPSSLGLQLWKFLVIKTPNLRAQLREASFGQSQVTDASHYVVLCGRRSVEQWDIADFVALKKEAYSLTEEEAAAAEQRYMGFSIFWDSPEKLKSYVESQVHLAAGFLTHALAQWRIDSCMIGGMIPSEYDRILGLEDGPYYTVLGIACGYRDESDAHANDPKVRYPASRVIEYL